MKRRAGELLPLEHRILEIVARSRAELHGFALAARLAPGDDEKKLVGHGTLYKALDRLREQGLVEARWEDPEVAEDERRPRRRLYKITDTGRVALTSKVRSRSAVTHAVTERAT